MGIYIGRSMSSFDSGRQMACDQSQPDPNRYEILRHRQFGKWLLVEIRYPNCTNYEGLKIMVFKDIQIDDLKNQKVIDPHFSENANFHSPVARFAPTKEGWIHGRGFCLLMSV